MSYNEPPNPYQDGPQGPPPPNAGYGMPQKNSGKAVAALVLGILGIIPCNGILVMSILGIVFGLNGGKEIAASNGQLKGAGMAKAGLILGIVGLVLAVLYWILIITGVIDLNFNTSTSSS